MVFRLFMIAFTSIDGRGEPRAAAASKMERFVVVVNTESR